MPGSSFWRARRNARFISTCCEKKYPAVRTAAIGVLLDVESCASRGDSAKKQFAGAGAEADTRAIRGILERHARAERACLAGQVLLMSARQRSFVDRAAIRGAKSGSRGTG